MNKTGQERREKTLVLCAVCVSGIAMPLSFTGPAVAMTDIAGSLGGSAIQLTWITNAFMLCFGSMLMAAGALADNIGRKLTFMCGIICFALASLALSFSSSITYLNILRGIQGAASAVALSSGAASLAQVFEGNARTRAFSLLGTTFGVGLAFGPLLAGFMAGSFGWRSIFLSVTATSVVALILGGCYMRESRDPAAKGVDWWGILSFTTALTLFTCGILLAPSYGWKSVTVMALLAGSVIALGLFVAIELTVARSMLDLSLFRYPRFIGVQFLAAAPAYCFVVLLVFLPLRLTGVEHYTPLQAGQLMIALSAPMLLVPMLAGVFTRWFSAALISAGGLLIATMGLLWLAQYGPGSSSGTLVMPLLTIGLGVGFPWGLMDGLAVSVVPTERAGMATGIFNTTRVAGEGVALAIVGAILSALLQTRLSRLAVTTADSSLSEVSQRLAMGDLAQAGRLVPELSQDLLIQAYAHGFHLLLYILAGITILSAGAVYGFLSQREQVDDPVGGATAATGK